MNTPLETSTLTGLNKYPNIFRAIQEFHELTNPYFYGKVKILSFGCSYGPEVKTLRDKYFHHSDITGCDINEEVLIKARQQYFGKNIYYHNNTEMAKLDKEFDIIFGLSVLGRIPIPGQITGPIVYADFEAAIKFLHERLTMGGCMVLYNSNYSILQSALGRCYRPVTNKLITRSAYEMPLFNVDGSPRSDDGYCIFKKINN